MILITDIDFDTDTVDGIIIVSTEEKARKLLKEKGFVPSDLGSNTKAKYVFEKHNKYAWVRTIEKITEGEYTDLTVGDFSTESMEGYCRKSFEES